MKDKIEKLRKQLDKKLLEQELIKNKLNLL